ncbi:MAG TPA: type I DNA topoisomerase [Patescibacteria group bacterium]|nr:type I DNA topoisomerase [Patescibacteria group bacterium]
MPKSLIIVESPTKAKTITRFLAGKYNVEASFGHVRDLPKNKLGVDVKHNFKPTYTIPVKAKETIEKLQKLADSAPEIILATDEDREGEAISWHLVEALGLDKKKTKRIVFHEITKNAIDHALSNPRSLDLKLVDAQQARRILDRLVGYELSPFLWRKIRYGLSAGRVQSVAVRLIVEREREIQKFVPDEYWSLLGLFQKTSTKHEFNAKLVSFDGTAVGKMDIHNEAEAKKISANVKGMDYEVGSVTKREVKRNPSPPFITSTLQQEAARKLGFSAKQTMVVAQQLYEGIKVGDEGEVGLITYMRTDSVNLAQSALEETKQVILKEFGKEYTLDEPRIFTSRSKGAQEAHEAIRPTALLRTPMEIGQFLDKGQFKLYDLIWKRTIACQMQHAVMDQTTVLVDGSGDKKKAQFKATGSVIKFDGFIRAYTEGKDESDEEDTEGILPDLNEGDTVKLKDLSEEQHFTEPPARYTDASLVKALEANGIGRPSTYAPTLTTIQDRGYVEKEEKKYKPTEIGYLVNDMLVENFPEIVDVGFTAKIEESFDEIAEGNQEWEPVISDFYKPFKEHLKEKEEQVEKQVEVSTTPCPHCGKMMLVKFGRNGKFLACPEPGTKITQPMPEEQAQIDALKEKTKEEKCSICGSAMDIKRGRFGFFLGCSRYPECKGISKIWNKIGFKCPNCKTGDIAEKKGRGRGKPFWACTRFPDCNFIINTKPNTEAELMELYEKWKEGPKDGEKKTKRKSTPRASRQIGGKKSAE